MLDLVIQAVLERFDLPSPRIFRDPANDLIHCRVEVHALE